MPKVVVFQHVAYEPLGTLNQLLKLSGVRIHYVNFERNPNANVSIKKYDGLIILGGPMNVCEQNQYPHLSHEIEWIQEAINLQKPTLGICLGAQLIAASLGSKISPLETPEIGWYPVQFTSEATKDRCFSSFCPEQKIFQWHGYQFSLPEGAVRLALSGSNIEQIFRYQEYVYGLQGHLEANERMIDRWLNLPHHQAELQYAFTCRNELKNIDLSMLKNKIRQQTLHTVDTYTQQSSMAFKQFIGLLGAKQSRRQMLCSR